MDFENKFERWGNIIRFSFGGAICLSFNSSWINSLTMRVNCVKKLKNGGENFTPGYYLNKRVSHHRRKLSLKLYCWHPVPNNTFRRTVWRRYLISLCVKYVILGWFANRFLLWGCSRLLTTYNDTFEIILQSLTRSLTS